MKKLGVRERIIETASTLFYDKGYNQTGINQIIEEAGVAKASMYQHFRSKEDIAVAYLKARHIMWMSNLNAHFESRNHEISKVLGCFDYLMEWLTDANFRGCGWQNIITELHEDQTKIRDQAVLHKNDVRAWLHKNIKAEEKYTNDDAEKIGDEILVLMEGAIILSQIQKQDWPIKSAKRACLKILM